MCNLLRHILSWTYGKLVARTKTAQESNFNSHFYAPVALKCESFCSHPTPSSFFHTAMAQRKRHIDRQFLSRVVHLWLLAQKDCTCIWCLWMLWASAHVCMLLYLWPAVNKWGKWGLGVNILMCGEAGGTCQYSFDMLKRSVLARWDSPCHPPAMGGIN